MSLTTTWRLSKRSRRKLRQPFAEGNRARGAWRGQLHEADVITHGVVVVEDETSLLDIEGFGAVHIADRHTDQFEFEIHDCTVFQAQTVSVVPQLPAGVAGNSPTDARLPVLAKLLCKPGSMTAGLATKILSWTVVVPVLAAVLLAFTWGRSIGVVVQVLVAFALAGAVLAAVNHAEVVAHRVGEPFGSLVLAIA